MELWNMKIFVVLTMPDTRNTCMVIKCYIGLYFHQSLNSSLSLDFKMQGSNLTKGMDGTMEHENLCCIDNARY